MSTRVLIVDGLDAHRRVMGSRLRVAGYEVLEAVTGEEALAKIDPDLDVIVLDVNLPDMTGFDVGEKFRLIIIPFRPFQHLIETHQQVNCLLCARKHLAPRGRLIVDFFQTDARRMHDPAFHEEQFVAEYEMSGGRRVRLAERVVAFHRAEQCNVVEMIYAVTHPDARKERLVLAWTLRYFFRYEVEHLLARCGFRVTTVYGNFDRSALRDDSPEMIFVAESG